MVSFRGQLKAWATPRSVSFRALIQNFRRASPPLSYAETPPPGGRPVLTSREECNVFVDLSLKFSYVFREILSTSMFFCCSIYIETTQNSREECNEFADLLFFRLSLCLSRDSLSCDTRSLPVDLCILFNFIFFIPLIHSAPFLRAFHTF